MLYRFTLTFELPSEDREESEAAKKLTLLKNTIKSNASLVGNNVNLKVEDEQCIQANKKRLVAPIITTLDTVNATSEKNDYLSAAKLLIENVKQLDENGQEHNDYYLALISAINCLIEKSAKHETEKAEKEALEKLTSSKKEKEERDGVKL